VRPRTGWKTNVARFYREESRVRHAIVLDILPEVAFGPTPGGVHGTVDLIDPDR
jgi:hypothetical protein